MDGAIAGVLTVLLFLLGYGKGRRDVEREYEDMVMRLEQASAEVEALYEAKARLN